MHLVACRPLLSFAILIGLALTACGGGDSGGGSGGSGAGGGGMGSMCNWMSALDESGCAPGVNLVQTGGPGNDGTVGSGGGYGGWYCFALTP